MRNILRQLFGDLGDNVLITRADGREWASVRNICDLMGIINEYSAVKDLYARRELNLTEADKRKFYVEGVHRKCPVWFVSETGLWKIVARSRSQWALRFRAVNYTEVTTNLYRQLVGNQN